MERFPDKAKSYHDLKSIYEESNHRLIFPDEDWYRADFNDSKKNKKKKKKDKKDKKGKKEKKDNSKSKKKKPHHSHHKQSIHVTGPGPRHTSLPPRPSVPSAPSPLPVLNHTRPSAPSALSVLPHTPSDRLSFDSPPPPITPTTPSSPPHPPSAPPPPSTPPPESEDVNFMLCPMGGGCMLAMKQNKRDLPPNVTGGNNFCTNNKVENELFIYRILIAVIAVIAVMALIGFFLYLSSSTYEYHHGHSNDHGYSNCHKKKKIIMYT